MAREQPDRAAEREQRRQPAQAPGEGRQVVAPARACWRGRACRRPRPRSRSASPARRGTPVVEQRVRVGGDEARAHQRRSPAARLRTRACAIGEANAAAITVTSTIPAVYLVAIATPEAQPGEHVLARAAGAVDPGDADQRGGQRRQRRRVVEREVAVVDRQERDREQRAGEHADAAVVEQPRAGDRGQRDGERAEEGARAARQRERRRRIGREGAADRRRVRPPAHREERVDDVRERRRVDEVVGVRAVPEHPDRPRDEVAVLVGVVDVRKPGLEADQAQRERGDEERHHRRRPQPAAG